jgi:hypothetical protein
MSPAPTPYSDLNLVLNDLVRGVRKVLGANFHSACLQGSFATGDFDQYSDVDFLIVLRDEVSSECVPALQEIHGRVFDGQSAWATHLEGSYITRDVLRDCRRAGGELWYLDNGSRSLVRSDHCNTVVVRWTVWKHGITLAGANAKSLVDPIPDEALRAEGRRTMRNWGKDLLARPAYVKSRWGQAFVVVSYCRMLQTLATAKILSKAAGVKWALASLEPKWADLIERAWNDRPNPSEKIHQPADARDVDETLAFVQYAIASIL